jgi:hypothetical protein
MSRPRRGQNVEDRVLRVCVSFASTGRALLFVCLSLSFRHDGTTARRASGGDESANGGLLMSLRLRTHTHTHTDTQTLRVLLRQRLTTLLRPQLLLRFSQLSGGCSLSLPLFKTHHPRDKRERNSASGLSQPPFRRSRVKGCRVVTRLRPPRHTQHNNLKTPPKTKSVVVVAGGRSRSPP